jgi:hypothetical protein
MLAPPTFKVVIVKFIAYLDKLPMCLMFFMFNLCPAYWNLPYLTPLLVLWEWCTQKDFHYLILSVPSINLSSLTYVIFTTDLYFMSINETWVSHSIDYEEYCDVSEEPAAALLYLKMEAAHSSKTIVTIYQTAWHHIQDGLMLMKDIWVACSLIINWLLWSVTLQVVSQRWSPKIKCLRMWYSTS